jgi:hypothetical protein
VRKFFHSVSLAAFAHGRRSRAIPVRQYPFILMVFFQANAELGQDQALRRPAKTGRLLQEFP